MTTPFTMPTPLPVLIIDLPTVMEFQGGPYDGGTFPRREVPAGCRSLVVPSPGQTGKFAVYATRNGSLIFERLATGDELQSCRKE